MLFGFRFLSSTVSVVPLTFYIITSHLGRTMSAYTETVGVVCHREVGFSCQLLSGAHVDCFQEQNLTCASDDVNI